MGGKSNVHLFLGKQGQNFINFRCMPVISDLVRMKGFIDFAKFSIKIFEDVVLGNDKYVDIILNGPYSLKLHSMGLVDENYPLSAPTYEDWDTLTMDEKLYRKTAGRHGGNGTNDSAGDTQ